MKVPTFLLVLILSWFIIAGSTIYIGHTIHKDNQCQEDQSCWNCETMGNKICGAVTVEQMPHGFIEVWDSHDRVVFGPVLLERIEK